MTVDPAALQRQVSAPVVHRETCPSTNDIARAEARAGATDGTFVIADEQTAGRGRTGNAWASPPGGVWSSTVVRADIAASHVGRLTLAGGLAAADTAASFGVDARLKWPNDVVVAAADGSDQSKLCGVLTEAVIDEVPVAGKPVGSVLPETDPANADMSFAVLGIGVNAALDPDSLGDLDRAVTTLRAERGAVDPTAVAATLHEHLRTWVSRVQTAGGMDDAVAAVRERSATLGKRVRVTRFDDDPVTGTAVAIDDRGALVVERPDGARVHVTEGVCQRLRRA
ncbi:biotin--[acetyl-CoA-carboxylase] ligase [Halobacterium salinarum]|uniref:Biotin acetyl-CoA carboxylase ligase n=5 Tax=Halobacterium salinarum TaxID=2242 RepID=Q9HRK0_HALSA|nr:biotin--[acetyl-CoA-carboxylase] ligase [Halobacterium salinarum]AAG19158.1 biotin acetyl-CoA carboxylase ligase [Halobacterium salinarum NRC-1]MBB6090001.1 BirA family biotin operon repressor/biotin-[acetyl-CoA-carboxylase] ligase [Halobacterium salinarum]MDL0120717.1 biotin--[acetyl-CoA-carboxylase] ligase [Halobacterium salinarum]MDL0123950.1 biotin--[acetyl-CoA-carboxylase] ligase [Halobacterium salinarum]MDL0130594.1 biotin--[acetyl-CoA-carboxylase] ligase [Halobacterium salinarum]